MAENWEKKEEYAKALAKKIKASRFKPDLILAIEKSGVPVAEVISRELGIKVESIIINRSISKKKREGRTPKALAEVIKLFQQPKVIKSESSSLKGQRVLIVDNSISSGKTIELARKTLMNRGVNAGSIQVASLYYLKGKKKISPQFYLTHRRTRLFRPKAPKIR